MAGCSVAVNDSEPNTAPKSLEEIRSAAIVGYNFKERRPFTRRLAEVFGNSMRPEETARNKATLIKLGAMLDHLSVGSWLSALASDPDQVDSEVSRTAAWRRFIHTMDLEPEILWKLPQAQQRILRALLPPSTDHPYLNWVDRLALGANGGNKDKLNRKAQLELDLLAAFAAKDHQSLIELATEFKSEAGSHSRLSINAYVCGELGLRGVAEAARFLVDQLLEIHTSPLGFQLMNWPSVRWKRMSTKN